MDLSELLNNSRLSSVCDHLVNGGDLDEYPERQSYAEEIKNSEKALYALADIGIHYDGWSVEDTEAFFKNYGITDKDAVGEIYKLILGSPANYLKYYIGYVEFLELKKMWVDEKGKDFLQKEFHSAVLKIGPAPFEIVEDYMWKM